ncbi:MAG: S1 RNA-binding domain-containing protein [Candidatus Paceibacterota bacterium]
MPAVINKKSLSPVGQLMKLEPDLISFLKEGELIEVKFLNKGRRAFYFDLGKFGTGVVYGKEFLNAKETIKNLKPGDLVSAKVVGLENEDGYIELSLADAQKQKDWQEIKELKESGETITVKIIGANSGGLVAKINELKAFLPVSQLAGEHYPRVDEGERNKILEELRKLVGQELPAKVIDFNPRNDKLIISEKEALEENIKELLNQYKVGDVVEGAVSGIADFGVFIKFTDNPAIEGLIHISELDHRLIENPKEIVKVDEQIKAKIIEIKDGRVSLSLKAFKPDPWEKIEEKYKRGQEISGMVNKFNPFGAFIDLSPEIQGLIHISEFGSAEEMGKQLEIGKNYQFIIEAVKSEEKRIVLKLKK